MPAWSWKIPTKIQKGNLALRLDQRSAFPRLFGAGVWTNKSADKPKSAAPARLPLHYSRLQHRNLFLNRLITARTIKKLQPPKSEMCNCATEPQHESEGFFLSVTPFAAFGKCWMLATWISLKISAIELTMNSGVATFCWQVLCMDDTNYMPFGLSAVRNATLRLHEVNVLKRRVVVWYLPTSTCARKSLYDMRGLKAMKSLEIGWLPASSSLSVRLSCLFLDWVDWPASQKKKRNMHLGGGEQC